MSVTFKLYFTLPSGKQEIRRLTTSALPGSGLLASLLAYLHATYAPFYQPPLRFLLHFDDGEDMCSISSESELQEAIAMANGASPLKLWCRFDDSPVGQQPVSRPSSGMSTPSVAVLAQENLLTFPASPSQSVASPAASVHSAAASKSAAAPLNDAPVDVPTPELERTDSNRSEEVEQLSSEDEYERIDMHEPDNTPKHQAAAAEPQSAAADAPKSGTSSTQTDAPAAQAPQSTQTELPQSADSSTATDAESVSESSAAATQTEREPRVDEAEQRSPVEISDVTGHELETDASDSRAHVDSPASRDHSRRASQVESASSATGPVSVHYGITCDGCGERNIRGDRYHCTACLVPGGFDLCSACEAAGDKHPQSHILLKMRVPADVPVGSFSRLHCVRRAGAVQQERPKCAFVSDVTLADGLEVQAGDSLTKVWSLKNTGDAPWPAGTRLVFAGGDLMPDSQGLDSTIADAALVPFAAAGAIVHVSIQILVPNEAGRFRATFRLETAERVRFGPRIWIDLVVPETAPAAQAEPEVAQPAPVADAPAMAAEPEPQAPVAAAVVAPASAPAVQEESKEAEEELSASLAAASLDISSSAVASSSQPPRFQYADEVATLRAMGFKDVELCRYLLLNNRGDVGKVVAWLLNNQP